MSLWMSNWKVWAGGFLIVWAAGLQVHMWRLRSTPEFKDVFGDQEDEKRMVSLALKTPKDK